MKYAKLVILLLPLLLTACDNNPRVVKLDLRYVTMDRTPEPSVDRKAQHQLAKAAKSIDQSLEELSAIQKATHPGAKIPPPVNPSSIGMAQVTSLDWTGPVEPLLKKIAKSSRYRLRVIGQPPAIPVIVSINAYRQPLSDILRNVTYQVVEKADIHVYPKMSVIELRYFSS